MTGAFTGDTKAQDEAGREDWGGGGAERSRRRRGALQRDEQRNTSAVHPFIHVREDDDHDNR